jgi:hypothetical protein
MVVSSLLSSLILGCGSGSAGAHSELAGVC